MKKRTFIQSLAVMAAAPLLRTDRLAAWKPRPRKDLAWALNLDVLETCSCPVFCQCFFTDKPPASMDGPNMSEQHVCRFDQAYRVNTGHVGDVQLDGAQFWFAGDAGDDFDKPKLAWAELTFDSSLTTRQRDALLVALRHLHWYRPDRWSSYAIADAVPMTWTADAKGARATLGGGKLGEVKLTTMIGQHDRPVTMTNMDYFGYPWNSGFVLMPSDVLSYHRGDRSFEYRGKGTNGLHTTLEMTADDFPA